MMIRQCFAFFILILAIAGNSAYAAKKTIGILVYDGVLTSDVIGPLEVFGAATRQAWFTDYDVKIISVENVSTITTEEGLIMSPDTHIGEVLSLSTLIVPSRYDMKPLIKNKRLIRFLQEQGQQVDWLSSNCSGAELLAEAKLLDNKKATTWSGGESDLQKKYPAVLVQHDKNYVIDGNILTSNGSVVSYPAAVKLLSLMSSKKLADSVFESLQMGRVTDSY